MRDFLEQISAVFNGVDALELFFERFGSHGLDCFLVHAAGVVIAHLLWFWRELWIDLRCRGLLRDRVQRVVVALDQFIERTPSGILRRDLGAVDPRTIGMGEYIIARLDRRIHVLRIDRRRTLLDLLLCCSAQAGCANEWDKDEK